VEGRKKMIAGIMDCKGRIGDGLVDDSKIKCTVTVTRSEEKADTNMTFSGAEIAATKTAEFIASSLNAAMESPSKEIGNYIADKIRYLRYESLLKIVMKAEAKAKANGMGLKMPPLKFFLPFCEAASIEEADSDESLADLWSNILLSAQDHFDARHLLYLRILKEITRLEATLLTDLIEKSRAQTESRYSWVSADDISRFSESIIQTLIDELPETFQERDIISAIVDCLECPGVRFELVSSFNYDDGIECDIYDHNRFHETRGSVQALEALGLINSFKFEGLRSTIWPEASFQVEGINITDLGYSFYKTVNSSDGYRHHFARKIDKGQEYPLGVSVVTVPVSYQ
jgi:hypothetical protein